MAAHPCGLLDSASYRAPAAVRRHVDWAIVGKGASASVALLAVDISLGTDAGG
ncbi:hypothetical protein [Corynebacterium marquesiae]|uniref:hypothetical protein n=1 Tax=Corynebacterium marquesiae TaxID=2913503 RepID=UPI0030C8FBA0